MTDALNFKDLRAGARKRLPRPIFEYIDRGSEDETSLLENRRSFERLRILPQVLTGGSPRSSSVTLFGQSLQAPMVVAPTACAGLVWYRGEIELARAALQAGIPFCAATEAITSIEEIAHTTDAATLWFQLYVWESEVLSNQLVERARQLGIETLVVTVDTPVTPNREYNVKNGMGLPFRYSPRLVVEVATRPAWLLGVLGRYVAKGGAPGFANYPERYRKTLTGGGSTLQLRHDANLTWHHIVRLRRLWKGHLVIKGIARPADALKALSLGADGIVVSNHGGRNMDSSVAPMDTLEPISDAIADRLTILLDSGVQRGSDIFKALALGAKAVMVGRAFLYGTAISGAQGATQAFNVLARELDLTMGGAGCRSIDEINRSFIVR
ncbi:alpha-hydroxy acid oxidase [Pseudomonas sp. No.117]